MKQETNTAASILEMAAMKWWESFGWGGRDTLQSQYFPKVLSLSKSQIVSIYQSEHPTKPLLKERGNQNDVDIDEPISTPLYEDDEVVENNEVGYTKGEWVINWAKWTDEAPIEGYVIRVGKKAIASLCCQTNSHVMPNNYFEKFPEFAEEHFTTEELQANAQLIASAPKLKEQVRVLREALNKMYLNFDDCVESDQFYAREFAKEILQKIK